MTCPRCHTASTDAGYEQCWWCGARICVECWEAVGHCGHPEAEAENERARAATPREAPPGRLGFDRVIARVRP